MVDIISYYCKEFRSWVVFCIDSEGNQIWECEYYATKADLKFEFFDRKV